MPDGLRCHPAIVDDAWVVAQRHNVPVVDIIGRSRFREHVRARDELIVSLYLKTRADGTKRYSLEQIGRLVGGRHHSTVWNSLKKSMRRQDA